MKRKIAIIGGGAAGFFGAIQVASLLPDAEVSIWEKHRQLLSKVKISGGGRCNVTHACFDPKALITHYPRGGKELLGPFHRFQPREMVDWLAQRGVELKAEVDGRMFPVTDSSQTIIDCFLTEAEKFGVEIRTQQGIETIEKVGDRFFLGERGEADAILLATGSIKKGYEIAQSLGHTLVRPVPSLFAFCLEKPFADLAGVSVEDSEASLPKWNLRYRGPLLLTPWGMTGPAILKLSAWGARVLEEVGYKEVLEIDWVPSLSFQEAEERLGRMLDQSRQIQNECPFSLPKRLWRALVERACLDPATPWKELGKTKMRRLLEKIKHSPYQIVGKTPYKEEFVTAGGVERSEVHWKTMESRLCPGLFFAGEILDVDGITGGFNFQNAWTTSWHAAHGISLFCSQKKE